MKLTISMTSIVPIYGQICDSVKAKLEAAVAYARRIGLTDEEI